MVQSEARSRHGRGRAKPSAASKSLSSSGSQARSHTPAAAGDVEVVKEGLERVRTRGNGAQLQTRMMERTGQLIDVVAHAVRVTAGHEED